MIKRYPPISGMLPGLMHGADYNPDQWLGQPDILEEDVRLMKLAGVNVMAVGIFSWSALEPEEGRWTWDWLDQTLDRLAGAGIHVWLATPSGARPAWMAEAYPEVLRVAPSRVRNLYGFRHNHCLTSPIYREKVREMNTRLAGRYSHHPAVVGWHISNEYGGECHCPLCQDAFRTWLQQRYGTLGALNAAWWTSFWSHTYTSWEQVESPAPHGELRLHALNVDWRRFVTDQTVDFCRAEIAPVRAANPALPVTTNLFNKHDGVDPRRFADVLDVMSWDAYPEWHEHGPEGDAGIAAACAFDHDLFRSIKGGRPFMLMESTPSTTNWQSVSKLKRPGMHRLSSLQAIAHGSDTVQYFQWRKSRGAFEKFHGAVIDHAGHEHTRVFREVTSLSGTLEQLAEVAGAAVDARAAIIFDWDNRWAMQDAQGPRNAGLHYEETVMQHYRALWELGIAVDVISRHDAYDTYSLVIAPMLYLVDEAAAARLEEYVEGGGTLVATYWSGIVGESDLCYTGGFPGPLRRMLGLWSEELDALYDRDSNALVFVDGNPLGMDGTYASHELCDLIHLEGAQPLAVYADDFYAGRPALTVHAFGKGRAYYLATRARDGFYGDFYARVAAQAGVPRTIETELPPGVTAQSRTDGAATYVFLMNFSGAPQRIALDDRPYTDMEAGVPVQGEIELPVHGIRVLKRPGG